MQIGDKFAFWPEAFCDERSGELPGQKAQTRQLTGRVIYIHPERRYFTVEAMVNGQAIRESFHFKSKK